MRRIKPPWHCASALVLSTVHSARTAADAEEAVFEVPGSPGRAILGDEALREDRALNNPRSQ